MKKLFVRNLSFNAREENLKEIIGKVSDSAKISLPRDRVTGKARGFAFIDVENDDDVEKIIKEANGTEIDGRKIEVKETTDDRKKTSRRDEDYNEI